LDASDHAALDRLRHLPTQFQAYIDGVNVRAHVVGTEVYATEIQSEAIDYRYAGRDGLETRMQPTTLPDAMAQRCVTLSHRLGLPFAGIDLKREQDGEWYCFEVNPSPAYSYYQQETGQPISDALVRFLDNHKRNGSVTYGSGNRE
jgi:glutathione synthase/RimK-type ligase-like ATP-grasp enzyme